MSLVMRKPDFAYAKTKTQISFAVTAKLISAFVFAIRKVQSLYYLYPKFQASSHLLCLRRLVCVGPGRKPRRPVFSERGSNDIGQLSDISSLVEAVFLELYGLVRYRTLHCDMLNSWNRLSGLHVCGHIQTSSAGDNVSATDTGSHYAS